MPEHNIVRPVKERNTKNPLTEFELQYITKLQKEELKALQLETETGQKPFKFENLFLHPFTTLTYCVGTIYLANLAKDFRIAYKEFKELDIDILDMEGVPEDVQERLVQEH